MGGLPVNGPLVAFGSSSGGGTSANFISVHNISSDGRYSIGLAYACTYNNAGTTISANSFRWRPFIFDAQGNGGTGEMKILPTPFRTTTNQTSLRRSGNAYAVSTDGSIIVGATEHNVSAAPGPDVDGGRLAVWVRHQPSGEYQMTYLDTGTDENGYPRYISTTPSSVAMNSAGTIIVARGPLGITKWVWDTNTTSFGAPIVIGSDLTTPASWLPGSVTSCGLPPTLGGSIAMSEDGNIIVGSAVYSTCGSFMSGGFIWRADDAEVISDWYDYLASLNTPGVTAGGLYGPVGDAGDPTRGLPRLGVPLSVSPDGNAIVGAQIGTQLIPGAFPWVVELTNGSDCVSPVLTSQPAETILYSRCNPPIFSVSAAGTAPTFQWRKDGVPLTDGVTMSGSTVNGASTYLLRILDPNPTDAGVYDCVVTTTCNGQTVTTSPTTLTPDPAAITATNDLCVDAQVIPGGVNVLGAGQGVCGNWYDDGIGTFCSVNRPRLDRWYKWTATETGNVRIETCGSNFDTLLTVHDSCTGTELSCNDNYSEGPSTGCVSNRSRVSSLPVIVGQELYIRISAGPNAFVGSSSSTWLTNLSITVAPTAPANDNCLELAIPVSDGLYPIDTNEATADGSSSCVNASTRDVWYTFTAPGVGRLTVDTCSTNPAWNTAISFHEGCYGTELACNDNATGTPSCTSSRSRISNFPMVGGQSITIRVGGGASGTTFGVGTLNVDFRCAADFNGDDGIDDLDITAFFTAFENGDTSADINADDGIDDLDISLFFTLFELGC